MKDTIRIAGVIRESIVDGPGLRFAVFTQGCAHACPECQNPETWDFKGGYDCEIDKILKAMDDTIAPKETSTVLPLKQLKSGELKTLSSGELLSAEEFEELCKVTIENVKELCSDIQSGHIEIEPKKEKGSSGGWTKTSCTYCSYKSICLFDTSFRNCRYKLI